METRKEVDPLGERLIPIEAYYGIQTLRAIENFPVSGIKAPLPFIKAYVLIKRQLQLQTCNWAGLKKRKQKQSFKLVMKF